jgi:hypothetical protein
MAGAALCVIGMLVFVIIGASSLAVMSVWIRSEAST